MQTAAQVTRVQLVNSVVVAHFSDGRATSYSLEQVLGHSPADLLARHAAEPQKVESSLAHLLESIDRNEIN